MPIFSAMLSDGSSSNGGGETTIQANDIDRAWSAAVEWAEGGDYPEGGCRIWLRVTCEETGEDRAKHVTIEPWEREYKAVLGGGNLGETTILASSVKAAWSKAVTWAREGIWGEGPADVHLRVTGVDGEESGPVSVG